MARRPAPPSSSSRQDRVTATPPAVTEQQGDRRSVDVRGWVGGIRLSGFMAIMLSLVVLGAWVLVPTFGTYLEQRQKIAALEQSAKVTSDKIAELKQQRERWKDPAFITTQARERLFYAKPGEVLYLVDNDLDPALVPPEQASVSDKVQEKPSDWMPQLLRSLTFAGLAQPVTDAPSG
ncbi:MULTISPECIES: FtsB family cell division protein [Bacteria]|uniref:FtsB family cell division protein n=1 Tax=Bacteria TaxID=2 RepID=UPI003C7DCEDE